MPSTTTDIIDEVTIKWDDSHEQYVATLISDELTISALHSTQLGALVELQVAMGVRE